MRPKSAIAEISTGGRTRAASEIGNYRNQHRGSHEDCVQNRQLPKLAPGVARGLRPKSAIAEISTGVKGADKNTGAPCDATASGFFRQLPDLLPVFYPDLKKEVSEVRSGSEIGNKSYFCPRTLQPQAFSAEANQMMKQSTLRPKSAIAEISTGGRTRAAPEIGNCRNQHQGHLSQSSDSKPCNHHHRFQGGLFVGSKVASVHCFSR